MLESILARLGIHIADRLIEKGFTASAVIARQKEIDKEGQAITDKVEKANTEQEREDAFNDIINRDNSIG